MLNAGQILDQLKIILMNLDLKSISTGHQVNYPAVLKPLQQLLIMIKKPSKSKNLPRDNLTKSERQFIYLFKLYFILFFFSIWVFFYEHSRITGPQGKGEGISLTPHYHYHQLHRQLEISRAIAAKSSPPHIASSRLEPGTFGFRAKVTNH